MCQTPRESLKFLNMCLTMASLLTDRSTLLFHHIPPLILALIHCFVVLLKNHVISHVRFLFPHLEGTLLLRSVLLFSPSVDSCSCFQAQVRHLLLLSAFPFSLSLWCPYCALTLCFITNASSLVGGANSGSNCSGDGGGGGSNENNSS